MKTTSIPWRRLSAEFLIIFVGVTLGLAADDWREEREQHALEREFLAGLLADLQADSRGLESMASMMREYDDAALRVRRQLHEGTADPDSVLLQVRRLMPYELYQPVAAAYVSLKDSGQLALIGNVDLRHRIVEYYEVAQPFMLQFDRRVAGSHDRFYEVALGHFATRYLEQAESNFPPGPMEFVTSWSSVRSDHGFRTTVTELGIDASNWALTITGALSMNAELQAALSDVVD